MRARGIFVCGLVMWSWTTAAQAATYRVSTNGSDANPGTVAAPFRTLLRGVSVLGPGDVLTVEAGTYRENLNMRIPSGSSWSQPVVVRAANPSARPVLMAPNGTSHGLLFQGQQYIVIDGFVIDGSGVLYDSVKITQPTTRSIRIINSEVKNAPRQGILTTDEAEGVELINLDVHHNGSNDFDHGIYLSTGHAIIQNCRVYQNSGWGIHAYKENSTTGVSDNVISGNVVFDNARVGPRGEGILVSGGARNLVTNNVVVGNRIGIVINYGASDTQVWHNTVVSNVEAISIGSEATRTVVRNNLVYANTWNQIDDVGRQSSVGTNVFSNPAFVNQAARDYRLTVGSVAVDAGGPTTVSTDIRGVARVGIPDVGAYELDSVVGIRPPTNVKVTVK